jgi:hypothetical protein
MECLEALPRLRSAVYVLVEPPAIVRALNSPLRQICCRRHRRRLRRSVRGWTELPKIAAVDADER